MTDKLTRREKERIIFAYLKGQPNPAYDVEETCHGKYVVKPKQVQVEEEEEEEAPIEEPKPIKQTDEPKLTKQQLKRERRKQNRRAKQDAYRILEQLNRIINANQEADDSSDDEPINEPAYRAASLIEQPNLNPNPGPITFKRKRLRF